MNRKGFHGTHVVMMMVLLVITLLVAVGVFLALKGLYEESEQSSDCGAQIRFHASTVRLSGGLKAPAIVCPSEKITVKADEDARKVIADAMKGCWDLWGNGQYQLFGEQEGMYCHVCAIVTTNDDVKGLPAYLHDTKVPSKNPLAKKLTYEQYLSGVKVVEGADGLEASDVRAQLEGSVLPADAPVGVIFYYVKGLAWYETWYNQIVGPRSGAVVGGAAGFTIAYGVVRVASGFIPGPRLFVFAGTVIGGYVGAWEALNSRYVPDYYTAIVVRPMGDEDIRALGCTYAPVAQA